MLAAALLLAMALEGGDDEQDAVCAHGARLVDLVGVDDEVLAQHRQVAGGAGFLQVFGRALEEAPVGEHREAGGAGARIASGDVGGAEVGAQQALAGAGLLDLGDHRRPAGAEARA
jgi:hypothetical protein